MIILGSTALNYHLVKMNRTPIPTRDLDVLFKTKSDLLKYSEKYILAGWDIELETILEKFKTGLVVLTSDNQFLEMQYCLGESTSRALFDMVDHLIETPDGLVPDLDLLYTIKMSHRYLKNSPSFLKTMRDIKILRSLGAKLISGVWYECRMNETYDYSHPKLNVGKKDFFTSNFDYKYDHDSLHAAVALLDKPAYEYYSSGEVQCSKDAFFKQPEGIRLLGVIEESLVLALERVLIPNDFSSNPNHAFYMALEKVCTSITSGWFREYAWENYKQCIVVYEKHPGLLSYADRFKTALEMNLVKLHGE